MKKSHKSYFSHMSTSTHYKWYKLQHPGLGLLLSSRLLQVNQGTWSLQHSPKKVPPPFPNPAINLLLQAQDRHGECQQVKQKEISEHTVVEDTGEEADQAQYVLWKASLGSISDIRGPKDKTTDAINKHINILKPHVQKTDVSKKNCNHKFPPLFFF